MQIPLSLEQEFYWRMSEQDFRHRTINRLSRIRGSLDVSSLVGAVSDVTARHEPLRLRVDRSGAPVQDIVRVHDLGVSVVENGRRTGVSEAVDEGWRRSLLPLDLASEGPLRVEIRGLARDDHLLIVTEHDLASDAWSTQLLHEELFHCYEQRVGGRSAVPEVASSYSEHVRMQRSQSDFVGGSQWAYWRSVYAGECSIPATTRTRDGGLLIARDAWADEGETKRLRAFAVAQRITEFAAVLGAVALACWLEWGVPSFRVTSTLLGRDTRASRTMIGLFHRFADFRFDVDPASSLSDFFRASMATTLKVLSQTRPPYSYSRVLDQLTGDGHPVARELRQRAVAGAAGASLTVAFELVRVGPGPGRGSHGLTIEEVDVSRYMRTVWYSLYDVIVVVAVGAATTIRIFHNEDVVSAEQAERLLANVLAVTRTCGSADAATSLSAISRCAA